LIRVAGSLLVAGLLCGCSGAPAPVSQPESSASTASSAAPKPAGKVSGDIAALKEKAGIAACPEAETREASGQDALPPVVLPCLGGGPAVRLSSLLGQPTLINVWASWCGPCRIELPLLAKAHRQYGSQVRFIGIDAGDDAATAIGLLDELDVTFPQVSDSGMQTKASLGYASGLPLTLFVDAQGRMVATERTPFSSYSAVAAALRTNLGVPASNGTVRETP
jgi:cytochrome c biogenesis protein CcmG/thiol:disulfide interchange protein DsbE